MKQLLAFLFILTLVLGFSLQSHAALELRGTDSLGNRLIYDNDLNITWYDYTKSATSWQNQLNWASGLTVTFGGTIFDDWRLPTALNHDGTGPCREMNCTNSEMGHLWYTELGNKGWPLEGWGLKKAGDFQRLYPTVYWSGTEYGANTGNAWNFSTNDGGQVDIAKYNLYGALAVRTGDVAVVPEPISSILFLTGGVTLLGRKYIKRKKIEV